MASNTSHYNLVKPAYDEAADVAVINGNMDTIDNQMYNNEQGVNNLQNGLAIVANGNTHVAITSGQYVFVKNHGTLADGLYVAIANIAANATLSSSNLTLETSGGLNALNSKIGYIEDLGTITDLNISNRTAGKAYHFMFSGTATDSPTSDAGHGYLYTASNTSNYGTMVVYGYGKIYTRALTGGSYGTWKQATLT